ncbi:hypothetical protein EVAR_100766_1 [Eumeta japonica]|uniref:Uncharacterized protein n=1 Tax=Eumeta variegata TaxID=151549 RepID=A0A4C1SIG5_EUMVA|nr:hypothetical protein EVAR_100766_1 [Eumeta japonica]
MVTGAHIFRLAELMASPRLKKSKGVIEPFQNTFKNGCVAHYWAMHLWEPRKTNGVILQKLPQRGWRCNSLILIEPWRISVRRKGYSITYMNYRRLTKCTCLLSKSNRWLGSS